MKLKYTNNNLYYLRDPYDKVGTKIGSYDYKRIFLIKDINKETFIKEEGNIDIVLPLEILESNKDIYIKVDQVLVHLPLKFLQNHIIKKQHIIRFGRQYLIKENIEKYLKMLDNEITFDFN